MFFSGILIGRTAANSSRPRLNRLLALTRFGHGSDALGVTTVSYTHLDVYKRQLFHVSTDYLLGIKETATLDISDLNEKETMLVYSLVEYFKSIKSTFN